MTVKITFLRHANAGKGDTDQARDLSELGRHQGKTRRNSLADGVKFDKVISSIALRAGRTAGIVADIDSPDIIELPEMYWDENTAFGQALGIMFAELGYSTLRVYFAHLLGEYLRKHGIVAWKKFQEESEPKDQNNSEAPKEILVVGHAVLLQAMAYAVLCLSSTTERSDVFAQALLTLNLGECEGFVITGDWRTTGFVVTHFELLPN